MSRRLGEGLEDTVGDQAQVVEELHLSQRSQVRGLRNVMQVQAGIVVRPADSVARSTTTLTGNTRELRHTSVVAHFTRPVAVGSFFQLVFDTNTLDLPVMFARCDRCSMLTEDEFEARFHFLQPIVMPGAATPSHD